MFNVNRLESFCVPRRFPFIFCISTLNVIIINVSDDEYGLAHPTSNQQNTFSKINVMDMSKHIGVDYAGRRENIIHSTQ